MPSVHKSKYGSVLFCSQHLLRNTVEVPASVRIGYVHTWVSGSIMQVAE